MYITIMDEFGRQLLHGYEQFGHREHLHMTWSYLRRGEPDRVFPFLGTSPRATAAPTS